MYSVKFELDSIVNSLKEKSFDKLKELIIEQHTSIKIIDTDDPDLCIFVNDYNKNINESSLLEKECRSLIFNKKEMKIVCYTYDSIYYNDDAKDYLFKINKEEYDTQILECIEGTLLTIHYNKDRWYVSTRKCLDSSKSIWRSKKSHYTLFEETIKKNLNISLEEFMNKLNKNNYYLFVLVHHDNINIIDYTYKFGENYKEIIHIMTRKKNTHEEIIYDEPQYKELNIKTPFIYDSYEILDKLNEKYKMEKIKNSSIEEGLIIKSFNKKYNKTDILKLQTECYKKMKLLKPNNNNIYKDLVELYQKDKLNDHLEYYPENKKIYDSSNEIGYDTVGVITAVFKVLTSELYELFKFLWDIRTGKHKNQDLYNELPKEYHNILYNIRGIYFKRTKEFLKQNNNERKRITIRINDIYNMLKQEYDINDLTRLFKARKIMKYKANNCTENDIKYNIYNQFKYASQKCEEKPLKMMEILLKKMFPDS